MKNEDDISKKSRDLLHQRESSLDPETLSRLQDIRQRAVAMADQKKNRRFSFQVLAKLLLNPQGGARLAPVFSVLAASVLVLVITMQLQFSPSAPVDDILILTSGDDLEMIQDLDFYDWLVDVDNNG